MKHRNITAMCRDPQRGDRKPQPAKPRKEDKRQKTWTPANQGYHQQGLTNNTPNQDNPKSKQTRQQTNTSRKFILFLSNQITIKVFCEDYDCGGVDRSAK